MDDADRIRRMGGQARFRDARIYSRFADPVLVGRDFDHGENEAAARAWFSRYQGHWDDMVAARWNGMVPLMLTEAMRDAWATSSGRPVPVLVEGRPLVNPHLAETGGTQAQAFYRFLDISWSDVGAPVRDSTRETAIVDSRGMPLIYKPPCPVYLSPDEPLMDAGGKPLLVFAGEDVRSPRTILGREVAVQTHLRLMWSNYATVLADPTIKMSLFAWNSCFLCSCVVILQLLTSSLAAFAFSRLTWPGRDALFFAYLMTLMIPGAVTQIPNYIILQHLHWLNSFYGLIVPAAASAYGTFLLRQYMLSLPRELEEAARIDGAGTLRIWWEIILPLCKPALITLAIFTWVGTWQSFTWPLIVAHEESVRVLPVALKNFSDRQSTSYHLLMAASLVMMTPMILIFIFGQKYFVRGIQLGAVKG